MFFGTWLESWLLGTDSKSSLKGIVQQECNGYRADELYLYFEAIVLVRWLVKLYGISPRLNTMIYYPFLEIKFLP